MEPQYSIGRGLWCCTVATVQLRCEGPRGWSVTPQGTRSSLQCDSDSVKRARGAASLYCNLFRGSSLPRQGFTQLPATLVREWYIDISTNLNPRPPYPPPGDASCSLSKDSKALRPSKEIAVMEPHP